MWRCASGWWNTPFDCHTPVHSALCGLFSFTSLSSQRGSSPTTRSASSVRSASFLSPCLHVIFALTLTLLSYSPRQFERVTDFSILSPVPRFKPSNNNGDIRWSDHDPSKTLNTRANTHLIFLSALQLGKLVGFCIRWLGENLEKTRGCGYLSNKSRIAKR